MATSIKGKRVAFLATDGVEEVEYTEPRKAVESAGGKADLISIKSGDIQAVNHMDKAGTYHVDKQVTDADAGDYDALVLPGGVANPDFLRMDPDAVRFVECCGQAGRRDLPRSLDAGRSRRGGRPHVTRWGLLTDLANAGATWVDEQVNVDNGLVTSRKPETSRRSTAR